MIPSAPKESLNCTFPEDASQFSASECDQSDEETNEKEPDDVVLYIIPRFIAVMVFTIAADQTVF